MAGLRERKQELDAVMKGKYETWSEHSDVILTVIYKAEKRAERIQLTIHLLANFNPEENKNASENTARGLQLSNDVFEAARGKVVVPVEKLIDRILAQNVSVPLAAEWLVDFFDELKAADERNVALSIILKSFLPYESLPQDLYGDPLNDSHIISSSEIGIAELAKSAKLIQQVIFEHGERPRMTVTLLGTALQRIVARHKNPREQQLLFSQLLVGLRIWITEKYLSQKLEDIVLSDEGAVKIISKEKCDNAECPIHGKRKEKEKLN